MWKYDFSDPDVRDAFTETLQGYGVTENVFNPEHDFTDPDVNSAYNEVLESRSAEIERQVEPPAPVVEKEEKDYNVLGGVQDIGKLIYDVPIHTTAAVASLWEDDNPNEKHNFVDIYREASEARMAQRTSELGGKGEEYVLPFLQRKNIKDTSGSTGFTATAIGAGIVGGTAGSVVGPKGSVAGALASSGLAAGKMSKVAFTIQLMDAARAEAKASGQEFSEADEARLLEATRDLRNKYALWEAIPEAAGNVASLTGIGILFKAALGKTMGAKVFKAVAGMYGVEIGTEVITGIGQQQTEIEAGLRPGEEPRSFASMKDISTTVKEVGPQVFVLTTLMGGGGVVAGKTASLFPNDTKKINAVVKEYADGNITIDDAILKVNNLEVSEKATAEAVAFLEKIKKETPEKVSEKAPSAFEAEIEEFKADVADPETETVAEDFVTLAEEIKEDEPARADALLKAFDPEYKETATEAKPLEADKQKEPTPTVTQEETEYDEWKAEIKKQQADIPWQKEKLERRAAALEKRLKDQKLTDDMKADILERQEKNQKLIDFHSRFEKTQEEIDRIAKEDKVTEAAAEETARIASRETSVKALEKRQAEMKGETLETSAEIEQAAAPVQEELSTEPEIEEQPDLKKKDTPQRAVALTESQETKIEEQQVRDWIKQGKFVPQTTMAKYPELIPKTKQLLETPTRITLKKKGDGDDLRTPEERDKADVEQGSTRRRRIYEATESEEGREVKAKTQGQKATQGLLKLFNLKPVFWTPGEKEPQAINGFVHPESESEIYINTRARAPLPFIVGHETLHQLKKNNEKAYDFLVSNIELVKGSIGSYKDKLNKGLKASEKYETNASVLEELLGDFTGEQFMNPEFLRMLSGVDPKLTQQIVDVIKEILAKIESFVHHGTPYIANYKHAQKTLAKVINEFQSDATATQKGEIKYSRQSTRKPTSKGRERDAIDNFLSIKFEDVLADTETVLKNVEAMEEELPMRKSRVRKAEKRADAIVEFMKDNLLWLHDKMDADQRARAKLWYDGARAMVEKWSKDYGISEAQASGVMAVLSPGTEWFINTSRAERLLDIMHTKRAFKWTPEMTTKAEAIKALDAKGMTLNEAVKKSHITAAMWLRVYDETHNNRAFNVLTPEGGSGDTGKTQKGVDRTTTWGPFAEIAKAMSIVSDGRAENIHFSIGNNHKVRNFYNNIFDPNSLDGFVTVDTHAVGAAHLIPFSLKSDPVNRAFGGRGGTSTITGFQGSYPYILEAYTRAAKARGILPREMQSITWEAKRALFARESFGSNTLRYRAVLDLWAAYKKGDAELAATRDKVFALAKGFDSPEWLSTEYNDTFVSAYPKEKSVISKIAQPKGTVAVVFEVAPSPDNKKLTAAWGKVKTKDRSDISSQVTGEMLPKILKEFSTSGEITVQAGGFEGHSNISFGLGITKQQLTVPIAKMVGYILSQKSMVVVSDRKIAGTEKNSAVTITLPEGYSLDKIDKLYHTLYKLKDTDGTRLVDGHTTVGNIMSILNFTNLTTEDMKGRIKAYITENVPGEDFYISEDVIYSAFILAKEYDYDSYRPRTAKEIAQKSPLLRRPNYLRAEATKRLEAEIRKRGIKFSRAERPAGPGSKGTVKLTHWSRAEGIQKLDPARHGTGYKGAESKRKEADPAHWVDRTYYGLEGYTREPGLGAVKYTSSIPTENLYDFEADPAGLLQVARERLDTSEGWAPDLINIYEQEIKKAGYKGYTAKNVAAIFEILPVRGVTRAVVNEDAQIKGFEALIDKADTQGIDVFAGEGKSSIDPLTGFITVGDELLTAQGIDSILASEIKTTSGWKKAKINATLEDGTTQTVSAGAAAMAIKKRLGQALKILNCL